MRINYAEQIALVLVGSGDLIDGLEKFSSIECMITRLDGKGCRSVNVGNAGNFNTVGKITQREYELVSELAALRQGTPAV